MTTYIRLYRCFNKEKIIHTFTVKSLSKLFSKHNKSQFTLGIGFGWFEFSVLKVDVLQINMSKLVGRGRCVDDSRRTRALQCVQQQMGQQYMTCEYNTDMLLIIDYLLTWDTRISTTSFKVIFFHTDAIASGINVLFLNKG